MFRRITNWKEIVKQLNLRQMKVCALIVVFGITLAHVSISRVRPQSQDRLPVVQPKSPQTFNDIRLHAWDFFGRAVFVAPLVTEHQREFITTAIGFSAFADLVR